ncbi:MAG: hypothetical protein FWH41_07375 [Treponema sp.]|nr:hypothetical protein [Treponema sp.]
MLRVLKIFIFITILFAFGSCVPPIGYVSGSGDYDDFWTVPRRAEYNLGEYFVRVNDLWAFASYRGIVENIPVNKVEIGIIKDPDAATPSAPIPMLNGEYRLVDSVVGTGRKIITVSYENKIAEYSITIVDPSNVGGPGTDPGNGDDEDSSGIGIKWKH